MDDYSNDDRADRAQAAINAFCDHTGDQPDESHFRDLLCDMMHLAQRDGLDFADQLRCAVSNFEEEGGAFGGMDILTGMLTR